MGGKAFVCTSLSPSPRAEARGATMGQVTAGFVAVLAQILVAAQVAIASTGDGDASANYAEHPQYQYSVPGLIGISVLLGFGVGPLFLIWFITVTFMTRPTAAAPHRQT